MGLAATARGAPDKPTPLAKADKLTVEDPDRNRLKLRYSLREMGVFAWLLRKFDEAVVGKEYVGKQRELYQFIVDQVEVQEHVKLLDDLLAKLASKESSAESTVLTLLIYFPREQYGARIAALVQSLPTGKDADWRQTLLAISKLRSEVAALVVDAILTRVIGQGSDKAAAAKLTRAREGLVEEYRKAEPLRFVRDALERG